MPGIPDNTNAVIVDTDDLGDEIFFDSQRIQRTVAATARHAVDGPLEQIKSAPAFFEAEDLTVTQYFCLHRRTAPRFRTSWSAIVHTTCFV